MITKEEEHYSVHKNLLSQLSSALSLPSTLVWFFYAYSEIIFGIAHTKASRIAEDNRGLVNATAYCSRHSGPYFLWHHIPNPVILWPPGSYQRWGQIAYHPHSISSIDTSVSGPKSSLSSVNLFTLRKVSQYVPSEDLLRIYGFRPRLSIHLCRYQSICLPLLTYQVPCHPVWICPTR